eukprot:1963684-Rhodomonas_salina.1
MLPGKSYGCTRVLSRNSPPTTTSTPRLVGTHSLRVGEPARLTRTRPEFAPTAYVPCRGTRIPGINTGPEASRRTRRSPTVHKLNPHAQAERHTDTRAPGPEAQTKNRIKFVTPARKNASLRTPLSTPKPIFQNPSMGNMFTKSASSIITSPHWHWTRGFAKAAATRNPLNTREGLRNAERVVIKEGCGVEQLEEGHAGAVADGRTQAGPLDTEQINELRKQGREVMLVSSGAVGLGRNLLGLLKESVSDPKNVADRQACAAGGQGILRLVNKYNALFDSLGMEGARVLITQGDFTDPTKYKYLVGTLDRLAALGTIPIINENDVVTGCSQLDVNTHNCFSDEGMLSALLASCAGASAVAMMTDVDAVQGRGRSGSACTRSRRTMW